MCIRDSCIAAQAVDLRPAGTAGAHLLADQIAGNFLFKMLYMERHLRPGAYKGHIPFKHVKELGQFVQAELADKAAEVGLAGVVVLGPAGLLLYIDPHGAELVHHEGLFVEADALLLEDNRPGAGQFHTNGRDQHDRAGEYDQHQAADNIQPALDGGVEDVVKGRLAHIDELALVQHIDGRPGRQVVAVKRHHRDAGAVLITDGKGVGQLIDLIGFQRDHDLIQGGAFQGFVQLIRCV